MNIVNIILALLTTGVIALLYFFRKGIRDGLLKLKTKMQIHSLRQAIEEADYDKAETGRKNMVVYETTNKVFITVQKKKLKQLAKKKVQPPVKAGHRQKPAVKASAIDADKIKTVEKKSLYVTN